MNYSFFRLLSLIFCLMTLSLFAEDPATTDSSQSTISIEQGGKTYKLQATGEATRKKFFIPVYVVTSYLQEGTTPKVGDKFEPFLTDGSAKQLTQKWVHAADTDQVKNGFLESFKNTLSPDEYIKLQTQISDFVQLFNQNVSKGDVYEYRWLPGGNVEVIANGKKLGSVANADFAKALWGIWFGSNSVVDRNQLVSQLK